MSDEVKALSKEELAQFRDDLEYGRGGMEGAGWFDNEVDRLLATIAERDGQIAELQASLKDAKTNAETYIQHTYVDPGANNRITWKSRAIAAEAIGWKPLNKLPPEATISMVHRVEGMCLAEVRDPNTRDLPAVVWGHGSPELIFIVEPPSNEVINTHYKAKKDSQP